MDGNFQTILGIRFYIGDLAGLMERCSEGGLVVAPAAPALVDLPTDAAYREAVEMSDLAITDSGFLVLLWKFFTGRSLPRTSGLKLLRALLASPHLKQPGSSFWIMPSEMELVKNLRWLNENGFPVTREDCHVAPFYSTGAISDPVLLDRIAHLKPDYVLINLGGGTQERLGFYLKKNLSYRPALLCTGAAIAFITGVQASIPAWADRWMLGWLFRCIYAPEKFLPRYWKALRLVGVVSRYREKSTAPRT